MRAMEARTYTPSDLAWLIPIAEKYDEDAELVEALGDLVYAVVVEGKAIMALFNDPHGVCCAGCSDDVRCIACLSTLIARYVDDHDLVVHGHYKPHSWQARLAHRFGFFKLYSSYYVRYPRPFGAEAR